MEPIIVSEHFPITDALRNHVVDHLALVDEVLPDDAQVTVILDKVGHKTFKSLIRVHLHKKDLIAQNKGPNLYKAIRQSSNTLLRRIRQTKKKIIDRHHARHGYRKKMELSASE